VQVSSLDYKGDEHKHVIVSLQSDATEMCPLNLSFSPPTSFKLIEGTGPVHLTGNHVQSLAEDELDSSGESDEEQAPMLVDSKKDVKNKRPLPTSTPGISPSKRLKKDDEDEEEESSEEDDDEETSKPKLSKIDKQESKNTSKREEESEEEEEESDEDDDEEEDEDEDEEDDSEEESDEDEESDEEESDEDESDEVTKTLTGKKDSVKKPITNGVHVASKKDDKKTPSKPQEKAPQQKTPRQKTPAGKPTKDLNTIKQALLKSPSLPKKFEKFKNFMRSSYKITDEETTKEVWEFVQKNKK